MLLLFKIETVIKKLLKNFFTGLTLSQEYICLDKTLFKDPLSVSFITDDNSFEVTTTHLFLGYKPLIIGIVLERLSEEAALLSNRLYGRLNFQYGESDSTVGSISMKKINKIALGESDVYLFEGIEGNHHFLNRFYKSINNLRQRVLFRKSGNIDLPGNLYDQIRIAYSTPRVISLVTVSDGTKINLFPTDLHGPVGKKFYMSSLRISGRANDQVEKYRNIVISEVHAIRFKQTYLLGKNHMKELGDAREFELYPQKSVSFGFPLPLGVSRYRELKQIQSWDHGIHRIHVYEVINEEVIGQGSTLAHIHQYYAQWRIDQNLTDHFLIR